MIWRVTGKKDSCFWLKKNDNKKMFETSLAEHPVLLLYSTLSGENSDGCVLSLEVTLLV